MRFGPYELVEQIGSGGMAEVHRARALDAGFDRPLALKLIRPQLCDDDTWVRMFTDEARLMAQLHHPNIVQVFDFGEVDGRYYLAMELVDGADLGWLIDNLDPGNPIPVSIGVYIALEVCRGLAHAHGKRGPDGQLLNLVHRDISPPNVLVSWEGEVKLTDFGIAKARRRAVETTQGKIKGKFAYMAPEQVRGEPLDLRTDLFALGALMHELLTGKPLFQEGSPAATIRKVMHAPVPPPSQQNPLVPPELDAIVQRALSRDPPLRYQTADALYADLLACARATTGTLLTSDLGAWMQGRRGATEASFEVDSDTRVERVVAGRMHGLLSSGQVSAPSPEPYFATQEVREGTTLREGKPRGDDRDARVTRDDLPRQRRRGRVQRGGSAVLPAEEGFEDLSSQASLDDAPSTLRVPKMAERPHRVDSEELVADDDAPTGVTLDETARAVVSVSPPLGVDVDRDRELDHDEATRVRLDDDFGAGATEPRQPLDQPLSSSPIDKLGTGAAAGHFDVEMGAVERDLLDVAHDDASATVRHAARQTPDAIWEGTTDQLTPAATGPLPLLDEGEGFDGEATAVSLAALDEPVPGALDVASVDDQRATDVLDLMRSKRERSDTKRLPDMEVVVPADRLHAKAAARRDTVPTGMPATGPLPLVDAAMERGADEQAAEAAVAAALAEEEQLYAFDTDDDPTEAMDVYDPPMEAYPSAEVLVSEQRVSGASPFAAMNPAPQTPDVTGPVPMPAPTGPPAPVGPPTPSAVHARGEASPGAAPPGSGDDGTVRELEAMDDPPLLELDKPTSKVWRWVGIIVTVIMLAAASVGAYFLYKRQQERKARREAAREAAKLKKEAKLAETKRRAAARAKARAAKKKAAQEKAAQEKAAKEQAASDGGAGVPEAGAPESGAAK